jgi:hypothetical protein
MTQSVEGSHLPIAAVERISAGAVLLAGSLYLALRSGLQIATQTNRVYFSCDKAKSDTVMLTLEHSG